MTFRALEKSIRVLEKSWKSPGNLFLKKGTNPVCCFLEESQFQEKISLISDSFTTQECETILFELQEVKTKESFKL